MAASVSRNRVHSKYRRRTTYSQSRPITRVSSDHTVRLMIVHARCEARDIGYTRLGCNTFPWNRTKRILMEEERGVHGILPPSDARALTCPRGSDGKRMYKKRVMAILNINTRTIEGTPVSSPILSRQSGGG